MKKMKTKDRTPGKRSSRAPQASNSRKEKGSNTAKVTKPSKSSTSINKLNYDCLAQIFGYLPLEQRLEMETVCRHWREALKFAWDDLETSFNFSKSSFDSDDTDKLPLSLKNSKGIAKILKSSGNRLNELSIGSPYSSHILPIVGQYCGNLRKLELTFGSYDVKWSQFLPFLKQLESLKIEKFKRKYPEKFFNILARTLIEIEIHSLPKNRFSATKGFMNLRHLRYLTLTNFSLDTSMIDAIAQKPDLIRLNLSKCKISSEDLRLLFRLDNLQHLSLGEIPAITDDYVIELTDNFKHLKSLNLSGCSKLTDRGFISLKKLPQLEELNVSSTDITDGPLGELHNLKRLDCHFCSNIRDSGIITLIRNGDMLEQLDVSRTKVSQAIIVAALEVTRKRKELPLCISIGYAAIQERNLDADKIYAPLLTVIKDGY